MKISLKWLNDYVDVQEFFVQPQNLADTLTKAGLEVEEIQSRAKDLQNVIVGLILTKDKHPNADKLSLCQVTTGDGVVHQIVCGAQNHKANDRVVVALPGAVLPGNFAIKQAVVRGVESGGMLCSLKELGLATESEGIEILPESATVGQSYAAYKGLDDVTFELKVTPNRADCLSHYGLAREISCLLDRPLKKNQNIFKQSELSTKSKISLNVLDSEACPRYSGRYIQSVKVGPTPALIKSRLETVGLKSINNIVDITNYVMMELGQPLHAFDADQIKGQNIRVEKANSGDKFKTLDGTELTLKGEELSIRDQERILALAGVIGGQNSGVSNDTQNIFLESAYFEPSNVRKTCRAHGIQTDSAYRFTRGVDPDGAVRALDMATALILESAGGVAYGDIYDVYPNPVQKKSISTSLDYISQRLGYTATDVLFESYLQRLGCQFEKNESKNYKVISPSFRFDLEQEMDLVEEYARLRGYDQIPETLPVSTKAPAMHDLDFMLRQKVNRVIRSLGYSEACNSAFASHKEQNVFVQNYQSLSDCGLGISDSVIKVRNPLSEDQGIMRSTLSLSLWKNLLSNYRQGQEFGRIFEIGKTFTLKDKANSSPYNEEWRLSLAVWGKSHNLWNQQDKHAAVLELKTSLQQLMNSLGIKNYRLSLVNDKGNIPSFIHRGQFALIEKEGKKIGFIGTLHPQILMNEKIRSQAAILEINLDELIKGLPRPIKYQEFSRFQKVERDLSLLIPKTLPVDEIMREMKKSAGNDLHCVYVFDQFEGDQLPAGQRSVSFRLQYQAANGTLQDAAVQGSVQNILDTVGRKWSLSTR